MRIRGYINAIPVKLKQEQEDRYYRIYITDALKALIEVYTAAHGSPVDVPRWDITETLEPQKQETAEEIIERITNNLKGS